jgi:hypothetical protein
MFFQPFIYKNKESAQLSLSTFRVYQSCVIGARMIDRFG